MTVYFIARTDEPSLVKIGKTDDLDERLTSIAGSFEGGIDLLATVAGDKPVETFLHMLFLAEHVEGEWFQRTPEIDFIIGRFAATEKRHFGPRVQRQLSDEADEDLRIAVDLLRQLLPLLAGFGESIALAQQRAFKLLHSANPMWCRRRVRALWEGSPSRVAHWEIRNLESALTLAKKTTGRPNEARRLEAAADWIEQ